MTRLLGILVRDEAGTTSIEYALIGTLVGVAIIASVVNFSSVTNVLYTVIAGLTTYM